MRRITYLDGLRGLACMQVFAEHFGSNFFPGLYLGFLANGGFAVTLFFIMSGFVLTFSFEKSFDTFETLAARRVIRLACPAVFSIIFAALIFYFLGEDVLNKLSLTGQAILQQLTGQMIAALGTPILAGLNPPIWTLSIELWGSILVLFLVFVKQKSKSLYITMVIFLFFLLGINELSLFTIGHLIAVYCQREKNAADHHLAWFAGLILIISGILICGSKYIVLPVYSPFPYGLMTLQIHCELSNELAAIMIFTGVLLTPMIQKILNMRLLRYLGKISFSIYLLHSPIMVAIKHSIFPFAMKYDKNLASILAVVLGLIITLGISALFDHFIDQPFVKFSRHFKLTAPRRTKLVLTPGPF